MRLVSVNPYVRAAMIQPAVMEGRCMRRAYDNRLFYVLDGNGSAVTAAGETAIGPDTLLYFRPGYGYFFRGKMRMAVINFDMTRRAERRTAPRCPAPQEAYVPALLFDGTAVDGLPAAVVLPDGARFRGDVLELVARFSADSPAADAVTSALAKKIVAGLFAAPEEGDAAARLCRDVRQYIRICVSQIRGNGDVARHFGYHPVYLAQRFLAVTGEHLHAAILAERVRIAGEWLRDTDQTIDEIAFGTGFSTRSHFYTAFRRVTGLSPSQYRKKNRAPAP